MIREDRLRRLRVLGLGSGPRALRCWSGLLVDDDVLLEAPPDGRHPATLMQDFDALTI